jgi:DNA polymerase III delta prime subunit
MWSNQYAPKSIKECILTPEHEHLFTRIISQKKIPNLLLIGDPGLGKTTVAKILSDACEYDCYEVNASLESGIDNLRSDFVNFASSLPMYGRGKVILFDEADYIRKTSQAALRGMIDKFSSNCSFVLTANYDDKILDPIKSRLHVVKFATDETSKKKMKSKIARRIQKMCKLEGATYESKIIREIINEKFPDIRTVINDSELALC